MSEPDMAKTRAGAPPESKRNHQPQSQPPPALSDSDLVLPRDSLAARTEARKLLSKPEFGPIDISSIVTSVSEPACNMLLFASRGEEEALAAALAAAAVSNSRSDDPIAIACKSHRQVRESRGAVMIAVSPRPER